LCFALLYLALFITQLVKHMQILLVYNRCIIISPSGQQRGPNSKFKNEDFTYPIHPF